MNKLMNWFREHNTEITWWIIGFLTMSVFSSLEHENYITAAINTGLIYINYKLWKSNNAI